MELTFRSTLNAPPATVWRWATSSDGVNGELMPLLYMSGLAPFEAMRNSRIAVGQPLGICWLLLFGFFPVDRVVLTPLVFDAGERFIEESPMWTMKRWRHERVLSHEGEGTVLEDRLTFEGRVSNSVTSTLVQYLFAHRHRQLRRHFNGA